MKTKTVKIGNFDIELTANAITPIRYTNYFKSDYLHDIMDIQKKTSTVLPQITYIMAKQANPKIKDDFETWLSQFEINDIPMAAENITELIADNEKQVSKPKKN